MDTTHGVNLPALPTPESLLQTLQIDNAKLLERHEAFKDAMSRFPTTIATEDDASKAADFAAQLKSGADIAESKRVEHKKPFDELAAVPHGLFGRIANDFSTWRRTVLQRADSFQAATREAERKRLAEEAARQRAEAERLAQAGAMDAAVQVAESAQKTEAQAAAPGVARTTGPLGGSFGSRTTWEVELTDITKLPAAYLLPNMGAITAEKNRLNKLKQLEDKREYTTLIPGCRIYQKTANTGR